MSLIKSIISILISSLFYMIFWLIGSAICFAIFQLVWLIFFKHGDNNIEQVFGTILDALLLNILVGPWLFTPLILPSALIQSILLKRRKYSPYFSIILGLPPLIAAVAYWSMKPLVPVDKYDTFYMITNFGITGFLGIIFAAKLTKKYWIRRHSKLDAQK